MPKEVQVLLDGGDVLSSEEKTQLGNGPPRVQDHYEGDMLNKDDFHFFGFNWDERRRAYWSLIDWYVSWIGVSGFGKTYRDEPEVPFWREFLMYPLLLFASISVVILAPIKNLSTFLKLFFWRITLGEFFTEGWNTFVSVLDAFYMAFLSPFDVLINIFLLLPIDIFLWLT